MTKEEKHLWYDFLKKYPIRFNRQRPIGNFIVDFYSSKAKLVIEVDGSQHYEDDNKIEEFVDKLRMEMVVHSFSYKRSKRWSSPNLASE